MTSEKIITVTPLTGVGKDLDYKVPGPLADEVQSGSLVRIPLMQRSVLGVVRKLEGSGSFPVEKLKFIYGIVQPFPVLTPELIKLGEWMAGYYNAEVETVFEGMLPAAVRRGMQSRQRTLLSMDRLPTEEELNALRKRAPKQAALLDFIYSQISGKPVPKGKVLSRMKISAATADALVEKGFIKEISERDEREAYGDDLAEAEVVNPLGHALNPEQQCAVDSINASLDAGAFKVHLLHGVTGSGKTEVYLRCLREVVQKGGGAVFLVPEVALTPQTVGRLRARLEGIGVKSVVWHSVLSDGERYDAWLALASGEAQVVVGARSAIFAPVKNLKLIIVDEEHEPAYKQADSPRYHGRDVAVYRAMLNKAVCVLGSATPSLESFYNVQTGKYVMDKMRSRIDDRQLPVVLVADMRREALAQKGPPVFSRMLTEKLHDRQEKGEQTILFINRRGYNTSMLCPDCGHVAMCDHCSVTLTHHRAENILRCHWCGFEQKAPDRCPKCRSEKIKWRGAGTQRIEDIAQKILPKARIVRIDADTMQKKNRFREILGDFRKGKIDILVGTQMIAKGLDFPNVTLVGLLDADISQHMPDFRAAERTFQLLVQVAGRAGRGDRSGEVVVQSYLPHSPPILFARQQDFDGFIEEEFKNRREYNYPPFRHLIHHIFKGKSVEKVAFFAEQWVKFIEQHGSLDEVELRGPAPAPMEKINDDYRYQIWYFTPTVPRTIARIRELRDAFTMDKDVWDTIDVDAVNVG
ncbi:MAG: primosomal protein N' [Verrucomicrobiota bacterium]|nr:primosomal protein N' [Verrucomicrobiota bacterium]